MPNKDFQVVLPLHPTGAQVRQIVLRLFDRLSDELDQHLRAAVHEARGAVVDYVQAVAYRAEVVDAIPASASAGRLLITAGSPYLYIGAGMGRPLRRLLTQQAPFIYTKAGATHLRTGTAGLAN